MDWQEKEQDDEFEAFLRQFRPGKPKALPGRRRTVVALAAAAALLLAVVIPMRSWWTATTGVAEPAAAAGNAAAASVSPSSASTRQDVQLTAAAGLPALSPIESLQRRGAPQSNSSASRSSGAQNRRLRVGGVIKPPIRLVNVNPVYPEEAKAAGIQGVVILEIVIGVDGSVIEARVIQSIPELDQAAIDAVYQWQYEPTLLNGEPVEVEMTATINFTLR